MSQQKLAYLWAGCAVALWSTVATAFKISLRHASPLELLFWASLTSTAALFVILLGQRRLASLRVGSPRVLARSALAGLLNPCLYYLVLFEAYARLPGQQAQPLNYTWAIALALLSIPLLKQKIRMAGLLAMLISFLGVAVISTRGDVLSFRPTDPLGVSLALGSSLLWAFFWILSLKDRRNEIVKLFWSFAWGTLFVFIMASTAGDFRLPSRPAFLGALYVGLFEMGLTFVLWLKALQLSRTTAQVSNLIFLAPFVSLVLLSRIAGEDIHVSSVVGLALIVGGILLQRRLG